jgi:hypothetical protein
MRRVLLAAVVAASIGVMAVWGWPGGALNKRFGDFGESLRDAIVVMTMIVQEISKKTDAQLIEGRDYIATLIHKDLDGQFQRIENLLKDQIFEGLSLGKLSKEDRELLEAALPEAARPFFKEGFLTRDGVIATITGLRSKTMLAARKVLSSLDAVRKESPGPKASLLLSELEDRRGTFTKECGRNFVVIGLFENVAVRNSSRIQ